MQGKKEHRKIARVKSDVEGLRIGIQLLGIGVFLYGVVYDLIAYFAALQFQPWYGRNQIAFILLGLALFVIGRWSK